MKLHKILFLFLVTSCTSKIGIIYKTNKGIDFNFRDTVIVKNIRQDNWSDSLVIRYGNGLKKIYSSDSIWGYKAVNDGLYRYYKGKFYQVKKTGFIIVYTQHHNYHHLNYRKSHTCYYFSKTYLSNLYLLNSSNLSNQFSDNLCFVKFIKEDLEWYKDYASYEKVNGNCKIFEYYNYCKNK